MRLAIEPASSDVIVMTVEKSMNYLDKQTYPKRCNNLNKEREAVNAKVDVFGYQTLSAEGAAEFC
jgi:hypothetical protein